MDMLAFLREKNPGLPLYSVHDPAFAPYGRVLPLSLFSRCSGYTLVGIYSCECTVRVFCNRIGIVGDLCLVTVELIFIIGRYTTVSGDSHNAKITFSSDKQRVGFNLSYRSR